MDRNDFAVRSSLFRYTARVRNEVRQAAHIAPAGLKTVPAGIGVLAQSSGDDHRQRAKRAASCASPLPFAHSDQRGIDGDPFL